MDPLLQNEMEVQLILLERKKMLNLITATVIFLDRSFAPPVKPIDSDTIPH